MFSQDRQSEREVIGCVAASHAGYLNAAAFLAPEDFWLPAHRAVFRAAAEVGDSVQSWHAADGLTVLFHEGRRQCWGLPDTEHVRVVAVADLAHVNAGQLWSMVRSRTTMTDEGGRYVGVVAAAAAKRREVTELEQRLEKLDEAS